MIYIIATIDVDGRDMLYTCTKCGRAGHNKRTCGKHYNSSVYKKLSPHNAEKGDVKGVNFSHPLTSANVVQMWEKVTNVKEHDNDSTLSGEVLHESTIVKPERAEGEGYTCEELTTVWALVNGSVGKGGIGKQTSWADNDNASLLNFVEDVCSATGEKTEAKEWFNFFKNFRAGAKLSLLKQYKEAEAAHVRVRREVFKKDESGKPELPPQLFPVFFKDSSKKVREKLMSRAGMPAVLAEIVARQGTADDKYALLANEEVGGEVLRSVWFSLEEENTRKGERFLPETIAVRAVQNREMPQEVLEELFHHPSPYVRSKLYQNPSAPWGMKTERARELYEEYVRRKKMNLLESPYKVYPIKGSRAKTAGWDVVKETTDSLTYEIRSAMVTTIATPEQVFEYLTDGVFLKYHDDQAFLSKAVRYTPLGGEKLEKLYTHFGGWENVGTETVWAFIWNPQTPKSVIADMLRDEVSFSEQHNSLALRAATERLTR